MIPAITTRRLVMRAPQESDFDSYAEFLASDRARYVGGPKNRDEAWRSFAAGLGHWQLRGFGMWAVEDRETGRFLGQVGLWYPEGWIVREVGWWLTSAACEGKGYAREAAEVSRAFAYDALGWPDAYSLIDPRNAASIALAKRLGAAFIREDHTKDGVLVHVYRHPGPEALH